MNNATNHQKPIVVNLGTDASGNDYRIRIVIQHVTHYCVRKDSQELVIEVSSGKTLTISNREAIERFLSTMEPEEQPFFEPPPPIGL